MALQICKLGTVPIFLLNANPVYHHNRMHGLLGSICLVLVQAFECVPFNPKACSSIEPSGCGQLGWSFVCGLLALVSTANLIFPRILKRNWEDSQS